MRLLTRRVLTVVVLTLLLLAIALFSAQYRQYAYAKVWHCLHGSSITFGVYKIGVPGLWWAEGKDNAGRIEVVRAFKTTAFSEPKIEVSPATPGQVADNEIEQLRLVTAVVSLRSRDPLPGWTHSLMTLQAKNSRWYCMKDEQTILGYRIFTSLTCNSPRIPYTLYYNGPAEQEKEAKSIFRTLQ